MKIVFLDAYTLNPGDLDLSALENLGEVSVYDSTTPDQLKERAEEAEIIITNKYVMNEEAISQLPHLKYIIVAATGYNNVDLTVTKQKDIKVSNVRNYSTPSVCQHVFAMLLSYLHQCETYNREAHDKTWTKKNTWSYWHNPILELKGKTLGILGFGKIGQEVAQVAKAFGMKVIATHKYPERDKVDAVSFVDIETLFAEADILSLHAPLNDSTNKIINESSLSKMKSSAILINTARGGLIHEEDLGKALDERKIAAALLDVLSSEPPSEDHLLLNSQNCFITPHQAWASQASRGRLLQGIIDNIKAYAKGEYTNLVS